MKKTVLKTCMVAVAMAMSLTCERAQANNLFGIDVSSYQGTIDWSGAHGGGVQWAFAKATEGNYYYDSQFSRNMLTGKLRGVKMGAYHFARPDIDCVSTDSNYFWSKAGSYILADGKTIFPMVDFEVYNGHDCQNSYTDWMNTWSSYVQGKTSHHLHPIVYSSAGAGMCDLTTACTLEAWVANYNGENLYTGGPWSCCTSCNYKQPGGTYWVWWQVSSTGAVPGISGNCDLDAYFSTLSHMSANDLVN